MKRRDIDTQLLYEIKRALDAAPHGGKDAALQPYADLLDCSTATVRRHLRRISAARKDCPGRPPVISDHLLDMLWDEKVAGMEMGLGRREVATRVLLDRLARYGIPGAAEASVSGVNAALKRNGYRHQKRHQRIEHDYALQVVLMDFSRSKYFQIHAWSPDEQDHVLKVNGVQLQYKEDGRKVRSWLVSVIDSHSRLTRAKMYPATGEDATLALLALREFWTPGVLGVEAGHPMHHPARELWMDRGAAGKTGFFANALASVGIDLTLQQKEAQGKIERQFRTLWSAFELPLALELGEGATLTMGEYNERLAQFNLEQASWSHPTMPGTREEAYRRSLHTRLPDGSTPAREIDVDLFSLAFDAHVRTVDGTGCVTLDRASYRVPERVGRTYVEPGMRLRVYRYNDGTLVANLIDEPHEEPFFCEATNPAHAHPVGRVLTPAETSAQRIDRRQPQGSRLGERQEDVERPASKPPASNLDRRRARSGGTPILAFNAEPKTVQPDGPREEAARAMGGTPLTGQALREYVGRRLSPYGMSYADAAAVFEPLERDPSTLQEDVDHVLGAFIISRVA